MLQGAAYAAFRHASASPKGTRRPDTTPIGPDANFILAALRETGDLVAAALGDRRLSPPMALKRRETRRPLDAVFSRAGGVCRH